MVDFHEKIKFVRNSRNLTQRQVAQALNVTERNYQRYEAGSHKPSFDVVAKLAILFQTSADFLLGLTDDPTIHRPAPPEGDTLPPDTDH
jgi:transcriptional regulator with XRE-family HTH domain